MKTILTAWFIAFSVYLITPYAFAADDMPPKGVIPVWAAYAVVGDVCVEMRNESTGEPARAEFWLVNHERVQWFSDAQGQLCIPVEFSRQSELYAVIYDKPVKIAITKDTTTSYFSVELPL